MQAPFTTHYEREKRRRRKALRWMAVGSPYTWTGKQINSPIPRFHRWSPCPRESRRGRRSVRSEGRRCGSGEEGRKDHVSVRASLNTRPGLAHKLATHVLPNGDRDGRKDEEDHRREREKDWRGAGDRRRWKKTVSQYSCGEAMDWGVVALGSSRNLRPGIAAPEGILGKRVRR